MKIKNIITITCLSATSILFGLFWIIAPALMKDKVVGVITFASADRQCFNYYKDKEDYFKDPDSAYMESSSILTKKNNRDELSQYPVVLEKEIYDSVVQIKVRAHNAMGGYVSDNIYCPLVDKSFSSANQLTYSIHENSYYTHIKMKNLCMAENITTTTKEYCLSHPEFQ